MKYFEFSINEKIRKCFLFSCEDNLVEFSKETLQKISCMKRSREKKFKYYEIDFPETKSYAEWYSASLFVSRKSTGVLQEVRPIKRKTLRIRNDVSEWK